eukprot:1492283-Prymnesium_polylepis.1
MAGRPPHVAAVRAARAAGPADATNGRPSRRTPRCRNMPSACVSATWKCANRVYVHHTHTLLPMADGRCCRQR